MSAATPEAPADPAGEVLTPLAVLPLKTCLAWGVGTVAVAALFNSVNVLLLRYVVDYAGISAGVAGAMIGASKLYDAVIDPVVGAASDRHRSKLGRRRPFLLAGTVLLAIAALALFNLPTGQLALPAFLFALLLYATGYALFSVPYMAMPAEMTSSYHERSRLISFRVAAVAVASLLAVFIGPVLMAWAGGGQPGHRALSIFLAAVVLGAGTACFFGTAHASFNADSAAAPRATWAEKARSLAGNRPFVMLLAIKLLQLMALAVTQASMPFLFRRVLQLDDRMMGIYFLIFYSTMIAVQPLWVRVARSRGKRKMYIFATLAYAATFSSWYFVDGDTPLMAVFARALVLGAVGGAVLLFGQSLLPDTMEWDYRRTGLRREGMLSAVYTIIEKISYALGAAVTGIILGNSGYIQGIGVAAANQPPSAITAIYLLASVIPLGFLALSAIALLFYDLDEKKLNSLPRR
ncbi:MAG: MFS transporter [Novosphingobium sp.]|uniref:MFS transporter n=1 Tax=Novosphingobium sp. TaxID=1874826 RepID=UPI0027364411|nr:MFS transporter [Novosphingobium sp.]MDP3550476.1 MFS transporter [Novosphingobium sp.]